MIYYEQELYHHGVKGMKWGVRRYQNSDGSLTAAGRKRYGISDDGQMSGKGIRTAAKDIKKDFNKNRVSVYSGTKSQSFGKETERVISEYKKEANASKYEKELTKMDAEAAKLNKQYAGRMNEPEVVKLKNEFNAKYRDLVTKNTQEGQKIAQKYIAPMNEALVKDLNIPNEKAVAKYITEKQPLWDVTYISNYAWFNKLA